MGALPKERANLLIVKTSDYFDSAGVCGFKAGSNQCFDSGEGAELVVYATRKDEFFVQAAELGRLSVEKLQLPVYNATIWLMLAIRLAWKITTLTVLDIHLSCYCLYQPLWLCSRKCPSTA